jgi:hypothetical protein
VNLTAFCDNDPMNRVDTLGGNSLGWGEGLAESSVAKSGDPREMLQFVTTPMPDEERAPIILPIPMTDQQWQEEQAQKEWWSNLPLHEKVFDALPPLGKFHNAADAYFGDQPAGEIGKYLIQGGIETALMAITWRGMGGARGTAPAKGAAVGSVRERVLANIAESRTARMSSRFGQESATQIELTWGTQPGRMRQAPGFSGWGEYKWRNFLGRRMVRRMGFDPNRFEYVHNIGLRRGGVHRGQFIELDHWAFNNRWVRQTGGRNWKTVLAHEGGHAVPVPQLRFILPRNPREFWADIYGAGMRGLNLREQQSLLRRAFDRSF